MMNASNILLLATKGSVLAFDRTTGARIWQTPASPSWNGGFVTLVADETRVYAHTKGVVYCLDLFTGRQLWQDGLAGLGYNLASLCLPGGASAPPASVIEELSREERSRSSSSSNRSS